MLKCQLLFALRNPILVLSLQYFFYENSYGQQFHRYQQNEQSPLVSHLKSLNIEKTIIYDVGNAGSY